MYCYVYAVFVYVHTHTRVEPALFYLVFGESVLNDAVSLTIFNISSKFVGGKHGAGVSQQTVVMFKQVSSVFCSNCIHSDEQLQ
jgi:NhaP-type Na+/H+ or K+/H+ antiporter